MTKKIIAMLLIAALTLLCAALAEPSDSDPYLIGEWETSDGMAAMTIEKNPSGTDWDLEIAAAASQGAYVFKTTIRYDEEQHCFTYNKGKFWEVSITDSPVEGELGEATVYGTVGTFTFVGDPDDLILSWEDSERPDETVEFHKLSAAFRIDYGASALYSQAELNAAIDQIATSFLAEEFCEIHAIRYAGDENNMEENLAWLNGHEIAVGKNYTQCALFLVDFHSPAADGYQGALDPDTEYQDYGFWFAREESGAWELVDVGY